jgi:hypothetical protein
LFQLKVSLGHEQLWFEGDCDCDCDCDCDWTSGEVCVYALVWFCVWNSLKSPEESSMVGSLLYISEGVVDFCWVDMLEKDDGDVWMIGNGIVK